MPVDFLTEEQRQRYARFPDDPSTAQLASYFHLDDTDRKLVAKRRGDHNRLGFAIQLGTVRFLGTFLTDPADVPESVVNHVERQLGVADASHLERYRTAPSRFDHTAEIKQHYGYRDFTEQPEHSRLVRWLYVRSWLSAERPSVLFDVTTSRLVERKVLLPGVTVLERLIARARERASVRLWRVLASVPNAKQRKRLEELLVVPQDERQSSLDRLRHGPVRVSGPALVGALIRLEDIRGLGVGDIDISRIPANRLKVLARYAAAASAARIARMPDDRRIATLLAFAQAFEVNALDDALDVLDQIITDLLADAEKIGKKERLRTLRDLDAAALKLSEACRALLDDSCDDTGVRAATFARVPQEELLEAITRVEALARPSDGRYHKEFVDRYRSVRRFLPTLLETVSFEGTKAGEPVLRALEFLREIEGQKKPDMSPAPIEVVPKSWQRLVLADDRVVSRQAYTLCVLERLQDGLRRRDAFVSRSDRWSDTRAKLLQGKDWESVRSQVCRSLDLSATANEELETLGQQLDDAYRRTLKNLPNNSSVRIDQENGKDKLTLSSLDKLEEPDSLLALRDAVSKRLPRVDLPEVLLEIHLRTGFADEFTHVSEGDARVSDLPVSVCAVLLAEACNIGLEPLVRRDVPALTRSRLTWVMQNYVRADTLTRANARLVDAQAAIPLAQTWGGGEVASADGLRFVTPIRTVNSRPNRKYFSSKRGITYYNFSSDQFSGLHGLVVPGTLRDSIFILQGLLEQQTSLRPTEIMSDTAGATDIVFGLFWLLGYQFSPRLADVGGTKFWRVDRDADYGAFNELSRHRVNTDRINRNWDDMLRVTGSLKMGTVSASELMRSLLRSKRPSTLAGAIGDLGRISKTIFLLAYIDDESYRRRILTQLNRQESRHSLARAIFHGKRGEIRKKYREGQEDQLGALGLAVNAVVLWNTVYMNAALGQLKSEGIDVDAEDVARLAPLEHTHINFLGRYSFAVADQVSRGELRPLRNPNEDLEMTG